MYKYGQICMSLYVCLYECIHADMFYACIYLCRLTCMYICRQTIMSLYAGMSGCINLCCMHVDMFAYRQKCINVYVCMYAI